MEDLCVVVKSGHVVAERHTEIATDPRLRLDVSKVSYDAGVQRRDEVILVRLIKDDIIEHCDVDLWVRPLRLDPPIVLIRACCEPFDLRLILGFESRNEALPELRLIRAAPASNNQRLG